MADRFDFSDEPVPLAQLVDDAFGPNCRLNDVYLRRADHYGKTLESVRREFERDLKIRDPNSDTSQKELATRDELIDVFMAEFNQNPTQAPYVRDKQLLLVTRRNETTYAVPQEYFRWCIESMDFPVLDGIRDRFDSDVSDIELPDRFRARAMWPLMVSMRLLFGKIGPSWSTDWGEEPPVEFGSYFHYSLSSAQSGNKTLDEVDWELMQTPEYDYVQSAIDAGKVHAVPVGDPQVYEIEPVSLLNYCRDSLGVTIRPKLREWLPAPVQDDRFDIQEGSPVRGMQSVESSGAPQDTSGGLRLKGNVSPPSDWITNGEAARRLQYRLNLVRDPDKPLSHGNACTKVSLACRSGKLVSSGQRKKRRIDPRSVEGWIDERCEAELNKHDED